MKKIEKDILKYYFEMFWEVIHHKDYDWTYDYTLSNLHPESYKNQELEDIFGIEYFKILKESQEFTIAKNLLKKFMVNIRNDKLNFKKINSFRINFSTSPFTKFNDTYVMYSFKLKQSDFNSSEKLFKKLLEIFKILNEDKYPIFSTWNQLDDYEYIIELREKDEVYKRCVFSTVKTKKIIKDDYRIIKLSKN